MPKIFRLILVICLALGLSGVAAADAQARTRHHHPHHAKHHARHRAKSDARLRTAQIHLAHLGYYKGKIDGIGGPKSAAAIRSFQHGHHIRVTGKLTTATYNAILEADKPAPAGAPAASNAEAAAQQADFYATHPDFYGHYDPQYADPLMLAPKTIGDGNEPEPRSQILPSRYAKVNVTEDAHDGKTQYVVDVNGQPLFTADNQPAVIGISRTFDLGEEDAIIFSTYQPDSLVCPYKHYLLTLRQDGTNTQYIGNCTRGYQAKVNEGSLFITFPESDDGRPVGSTWRYEGGRLEKL